MTKTPSIKQMTYRANSGHIAALNAIAEGKPVVRPDAYMGEIRGMRTVLETLRAWECVADGKLTERGEELRRLLNERHRKAMARTFIAQGRE